MKSNKKVLFTMILVLIISVVFGCSDDSSLVPKNNIDTFLDKKSELYDKREDIINAFESDTKELEVLPPEGKEADDGYIMSVHGENLGEVLKDIRELLTEDEYERLLYNRYLIDQEMLEDKYDKSEVKDIEYEKVSEDEERIVYSVKYTENLYFEGELKEEKKIENEFTLEKVDDKWLISRIG